MSTTDFSFFAICYISSQILQSSAIFHETKQLNEIIKTPFRGEGVGMTVRVAECVTLGHLDHSHGNFLICFLVQ